MSSPGFRTSTLFPFTPWGLTVLGVAGGVLILGAARMELATLIWGSSFVLLALYALAGSHATCLLLRRRLRRRPAPLDFRLPAGGLFPGTASQAEIDSELPRAGAPGFQLWFAAALSWSERPPLRLAALLSPGRKSSTVSFRAPPRGLYRGDSAALVVRDVLGFTRAEIAVPLAEQLRVFPSVLSGGGPVIPPGSGGEEPPHAEERRASDDLLEVRKYYPGDDLRRVHWKLYAHMQQLFLRTGENVPPPESRFLAVLDLSPSPWLPVSERPEVLDGLLEACVSDLLALLARGLRVQLGATDRPELVCLAPERPEALLGLCSELRWSETLALELPRTGRREVLLYSTAGSPRQRQLLRACALRHWGVHLFVKQLPEPAPPGGSPLRRWFLKETGPPPRRPAERLLRERYRQALEESESGRGRMRNLHVARI